MNEYRKNRLIQIAQSLIAKRSGRSFHISFILKNNQLLVTATNDYTRLHPYHKYGIYKPYKDGNENYVAGRHSEINAISTYLNKFGNLDMSGLTLMNVRIGYNGEVMSSMPCKNCSRILNSFSFKSIIHT